MTLLTAVVTGLLSGGIVAAIASLVTARAMARRTAAETNALDAKLPAEIDSVIVTGAEQAVLTMDRALQSATAHIAKLEKDRAADARKIEQLEKRVEELRRKVTAAERALNVAIAATKAVQEELAEFVREQQARK